MRKKGFIIVLSAFMMIMAFWLQGCSLDNTAYDEEPVKDSESIAGSLITVGFSQVGSESDWRMANTKSVQEAFTVDKGYALIFNDGQQKQENQIKAIREFIDQDVDYILLDPCVEKGWDSALREAKEAGIPVIVYDRMVDVSDTDLYDAWIGSDFYLEGKKACTWLTEYLESIEYDGDINIVDLQGTLGASAQIGRTKALNDAVSKNGKWHLIAQETGDFTTAKGKEIMEAMLIKNGGNINVVYCENDNMAYGAIEAIRAAGYKIGTNLKNNEILILSFDASNEGLRLTMDGVIAVNTECSPLYGDMLVEMIEALGDGEKLEKNTYIEEEQFSNFKGIGSLRIDGNSYFVNEVDEELLENREY
ncbi:MAG: ABC transporter substrate-binding protein [Lachnospiraceae bacterium]|nr:ABC transporter substrate-binding protein [Lachnospiraceae bacterium]